MVGKWRDTTLGDLVDFVSGGTPSKGNAAYWNGAIPWVSAKDMKRFLLDDAEDHITESGLSNGTRLAPTRAVLLLTRGMTLLNDIPICVAQRPMAFNQDVKALRPKGQITDSFIPYLLLGNKSRLLNLVDLAGHGTGRLNTDELKSLDVRLPPENEQRAIAHILGTLDDKIELNRRMNETLEAMARALFQSWFVDFDPVRAKMEGRWCQGESLPGPPAHLYDLFPDSFEESELGEIPRGWGVKSIYDIADVVYGAPFSSSQFNLDRNGRPLIRIRDLPGERPQIWTPEIHLKAYMVRPGDIVVGMDGEFRAYLWGGDEAWLNQRVCVFVPKKECSAAFVRNSIIGPLADIEETETATTVIHLGKSDIDRFTAVVPSAAVLAAFNHICQPWYDRVVATKRESRTITYVRDGLLPRLISGDIRLNEVQHLVEATMVR